MKKKIGLLLIAALLISVPNCTNADGTTKIEINGKQVAYTKEHKFLLDKPWKRMVAQFLGMEPNRWQLPKKTALQ